MEEHELRCAKECAFNTEVDQQRRTKKRKTRPLRTIDPLPSSNNEHAQSSSGNRYALATRDTLRESAEGAFSLPRVACSVRCAAQNFGAKDDREANPQFHCWDDFRPECGPSRKCDIPAHHRFRSCRMHARPEINAARLAIVIAGLGVSTRAECLKCRWPRAQTLQFRAPRASNFSGPRIARPEYAPVSLPPQGGCTDDDERREAVQHHHPSSRNLQGTEQCAFAAAAGEPRLRGRPELTRKGWPLAANPWRALGE